MKKSTVIAAVLLVSASVSYGDGGDSPLIGGGEAQPSASASDEIFIDWAWAAGNPALVGLENQRQTRLSLFPTSISLWNDKVALPLSGMSSTKSWVTALLRESFGIKNGLTPDEVSQKLTDELRDGIYFCAGVQTSPVDFATRNLGFNVRTFANADLQLPGGLFLPFFSATEGLLAGNSLDLSSTRVSEVWATEIGAKYGHSISIPFIRDYLWLDEGAVGLGVKALIGHHYFSVEANDSSKLYYDPVSNKYKAGMSLDAIRAQGGYGWGFDLGTVFHNDNHAVSIDVQDIGMIQWPGQKVFRGKVTIGELDLNGGGTDFFDVGSLKSNGKGYVMWLPTTLNAGYLYYLNLSAYYGNGLGLIMDYLSASLIYNQPLALAPGTNSYAPRVSAGAKLGFMGGYLPVRYGIIFGGSEKVASTAGVEIGKQGSFSVSYKAVGSPILWPKRGFEIAFAQTKVWGGKGKAKDKGKTPPPVQPIDTASAAPVAPAVKEAAVDTASAATAPPAVHEKAVDTVTAPQIAPEGVIDTAITPPAIPEEAVDTASAANAPPAVHEGAIDTTAAHHIKTVDTTATHHTVPAKAVDTTAVHLNVPAKAVDTTSTHHTVPAKAVDTTATHHTVPAKAVDTTSTHHTVPAKAVDTTSTHHTVPAKAVDTTSTHHTVPAKVVDTTATHHTVPAKAVDTTAARHTVPAKAVDTTAAHHTTVPTKTTDTTATHHTVPEVKKSSEENKQKVTAPPATPTPAAPERKQ